MCDEGINFARHFWKELGLNNSKGAGMTLIENGKVIKRHGNETNTDRMREMGNSIVFYKRGKK
jgi:hypothetical protein